MRLTILNNNDEVVSIEGKGNVVLPAFLFMRDVTNAANNVTQTTTPAQTSRPTSKTGGLSFESMRLFLKKSIFFQFKERIKRMVVRLLLPVLIEAVFMNQQL